ncbi:MAG: hypothetical protein Q8S13_02235, partial [Dehalococcoidia bacterium]|nr:hypothetical protein [Dehalococcoidia bacterium]
YEELYERALAVQEIIDSEYLPRLYRRKTRKGRPAEVYRVAPEPVQRSVCDAEQLALGGVR